MGKRLKTIDIPYGSQVEMHSNVDRLRFVVGFAQADLKGMRAGDKLNLREDLFSFADVVCYSSEEGLKGLEAKLKQGTALAPAPTSPEDITDKALEEAQGEFREILRGVTQPRLGPAEFFSFVTTMPQVRFHARVDRNKQTFIFPEAEIPDLLRFRLLQLLGLFANLYRLRMCPECKKIFVKVKRQKYCSQTCANRAYMREYRAIGGVRDANHKQYEKRKEEKTGKPANVARRPRSRK
jgi:hypothetical protein